MIGCGAQKRLTWVCFVLLLSTLVCCQPTELIWAFCHNFSNFNPPGFEDDTQWNDEYSCTPIDYSNSFEPAAPLRLFASPPGSPETQVRGFVMCKVIFPTGDHGWKRLPCYCIFWYSYYLNVVFLLFDMITWNFSEILSFNSEWIFESFAKLLQQLTTSFLFYPPPPPQIVGYLFLFLVDSVPSFLLLSTLVCCQPTELT